MTDPLTWQTSHPTSEIGRAGPGTVVDGRYTLHAAVGHGGMGTVWRATDTQLGRAVAVKEVVPPPGIAPEDRDAMYERMLREARAAAMLSHPGVVQVYDVVTDIGRPWIVMELLDARSLSDMVLEDGPLAPRAVAKIGVTLLGALEVAHAAGVLHRDVKPANVLVSTDGRCVLTDFGVARMPTDQQLTTPGMVLGSPHFISPERALGASFGPPSDLFSLGVTLYCAVEGRPPFDKGEPIATMHSVVEDQPLPPQRAGVLTEVLYGLLEKDPTRRWDAPTSRQVLRDLLAGPLASRTPQFPTDPYAVVPAQRLPWQGGEQPADEHRQIGGRALLAPDEAPTDRTGAATERFGAATSAAADPYGRDQYGPGGHRPDPYHQEGYGQEGYGQGGHRQEGYGQGGHRQGGHRRDAYRQDAYGSEPDPYRYPPGDPAAGMAGAGRPTPAGQQRIPAGAGAGAATRAALGQLAAAAQRAPRKAVMGAAIGLAAVVLIAAVWTLATGRGDGESPPAAPGSSPGLIDNGPGDRPLIPVQEFAARGMVINLPEGWREQEDTPIRVDFVDPDDPVARIRLLTESSGREARQFVEEIAEPFIESNCPEPYQRVDLTEIDVDGHSGTHLEYTCGSGDTAQRTLWVTTVRDGTAYSFFLRLSASQFEERRVIFDEMVASFHVTAA